MRCHTRAAICSIFLVLGPIAVSGCSSVGEAEASVTCDQFSNLEDDWLQRAEDGDRLFQYDLGFCYEKLFEYDKAAEWYLPSAEGGLREAQYRLGLFYFDGRSVPQNSDLALFWWNKSANQGLAQAQYMLGYYYQHYAGATEPNLFLAERHYRRAADQDFVMAVGALGGLYARGEGFFASYDEAMRLLQPLADGGNSRSQFLVGNMYARGLGVPKDFETAYMWLNLAAAGGQEDAATLRDEIEESMTNDQLMRAQEQSRQWQAKPALLDHHCLQTSTTLHFAWADCDK